MVQRIGLLVLLSVPLIYGSTLIINNRGEECHTKVGLGLPLRDVVASPVTLRDSASNIFDISCFSHRVHILIFSGQEPDGDTWLARKLSNHFLKRDVAVVRIVPEGATLPGSVPGARTLLTLQDEQGQLARQLSCGTEAMAVVIDGNGVIVHVTEATKSNDKSITATVDGMLPPLPPQ